MERLAHNVMRAIISNPESDWPTLPQVMKMGGLRRGWAPRYLIISHRRRYQQLTASDDSNGTGAIPQPDLVLLTWFNSPTEFTVAGKVRESCK